MRPKAATDEGWPYWKPSGSRKETEQQNKTQKGHKREKGVDTHTTFTTMNGRIGRYFGCGEHRFHLRS